MPRIRIRAFILNEKYRVLRINVKFCLILVLLTLSFKSTYAQNGSITWSYPTGEKKYQAYVQNGELHGPWTQWWENGQKKNEGEWIDGLPVGKWNFWYPDGKLKRQGSFSNGEKICSWKYWDEKGKVTIREHFDDGTCKKFRLTSFSIAPLVLVQEKGGYVFTVLSSWRPGYKINKRFMLGANLAIFPLKGPRSYFLGIEYSAFADVSVETFQFASLELNLGAQTWLSKGTAFLGGLLINIHLDEKIVPLIDRAFIGYSALLIPKNLTNQIRIGIGTSL